MRKTLRNNIYVELSKDTLRGFKLTTNSEEIYTKRDDKLAHITTIIIEDIYTLRIGDIVEVDGNTYTINYIRQHNNTFYCIQERATKVSQFILPLLGGTYEFYDFEESFFNSYISEDYNFIYLLYKFVNSEKYLVLEDTLTNHPRFEEIIDPNPDMVIFKFKIPSTYKGYVDLIMRGKYRAISPGLKTKICEFHRFGVNSKTYRMLFDDNTLREEMERTFNCAVPKEIDLMSKPKLNKEIWIFQDILKKDGMLS